MPIGSVARKTAAIQDCVSLPPSCRVIRNTAATLQTMLTHCTSG
jgi:hypothetical protein